MKKFIFLTVKFIIFLLLFCQCTNDSMVEGGRLSTLPGACFPEVSDKYIYPVTPGMEEWQKSDDIYSLVQLPDGVLKSISTFGLIDALVNSPLFAGFYFLSNSSSPVETWQSHYARFNCAKELFQRKDAGNALVTYYSSVCFDCLESSAKPLEVKEQIMGLEFLFTKQEILDNIPHIKKQVLIANFLRKYEQMPDAIYRVFPMVWIMNADRYRPLVDYYQDKAEYLQILLNGFIPDYNQVDIIISFAKSFINDKS